MKKIINSFAFLGIVAIFSSGIIVVNAQTFIKEAPVLLTENTAQKNTVDIEVASAYQKIIEVPVTGVVVPTVVSLPLVESVSRQEKFLVYEVETDMYVNSYLYNDTIVQPYMKNVVTNPVVENTVRMVDGNLNTFTNFEVTGSGKNKVMIVVETSRPIDTSRLRLQLEPYVALPGTIEIKAGLRGSSTRLTIVAEKELNSPNVTFPKTTADVFEITFQYSQPLRITELNFFDDGAVNEVQQSLRFLAQPNTSYQVFYDADRPVSIAIAESGNLRNERDITDLFVYRSQPNSFYLPADVDEDGIRDVMDNCVRIANHDQIDINDNGRGDACDDFDRDGVINSLDNCINQPNRSQVDEDRDGIGDVCDDQESRFTESNPWVPWVGMGTSIIVIIILFILVARGPKRVEEMP